MPSEPFSVAFEGSPAILNVQTDNAILESRGLYIQMIFPSFPIHTLK